MNTIEILNQMYTTFSDPKKWCQCTGARDANLHRIPVKDPNATSWCLMGLAYKLTDCETDTPVTDALRNAIPDGFGVPKYNVSRVAYYNDSVGHEAVLELIQRAIENEIKKE